METGTRYEHDEDTSDALGDDEVGPVLPAPRRRSSGRRQRLRRAERRRRRVRTAATVLLLAGIAALGVWGAMQLPLLDRDDPQDQASGPPVTEDAQTALVFATFEEARRTDGASLVFVLATGPGDDATLLFLPTTTLADIPGHGLERIGRAYAFGGAPLLDATVDNLLGVDFDGVVEVSESGWASLLGRVAPLTVDVAERLVETAPDGSRRLRFEAGPQPLDGPRLAELLAFQSSDETDLDRIPRARRVLDALLGALAADPAALDGLFADGAPMLDTAVAEDRLRALLEAVASAAANDDLEVLTLPVSPIGSGEESSYRLDAERGAEVVNTHFAASVPGSPSQGGRRLQILNGNGEPGIGQEVAERLLPAGFRVVLTDNADRFDHERTRILVYDDGPEQLAVASEVQRLLGVGDVEVSRAPQSVVDVTIVIGRDFLGDPPAATPGATG